MGLCLPGILGSFCWPWMTPTLLGYAASGYPLWGVGIGHRGGTPISQLAGHQVELVTQLWDTSALCSTSACPCQLRGHPSGFSA